MLDRVASVTPGAGGHQAAGPDLQPAVGDVGDEELVRREVVLLLRVV
jgi:hypothetical protein